MKTTGLDIREAVKATEAGNRVKRQIFGDYDIGHEEWASYKLEGDDLLAEDWEIVPDPPKTVTFQEALQHLKQGKTIHRINGHKYYYIPNHPHMFSIQDIDATDWVVVED